VDLRFKPDHKEGWLEVKKTPSLLASFGGKYQRRYLRIDERTTSLCIYTDETEQARSHPLRALDLRICSEVLPYVKTIGSSPDSSKFVLEMARSRSAEDRVKLKAMSSSEGRAWMKCLNEWRDYFLVAWTTSEEAIVMTNTDDSAAATMSSAGGGKNNYDTCTTTASINSMDEAAAAGEGGGEDGIERLVEASYKETPSKEGGGGGEEASTTKKKKKSSKSVLFVSQEEVNLGALEEGRDGAHIDNEDAPLPLSPASSLKPKLKPFAPISPPPRDEDSNSGSGGGGGGSSKKKKKSVLIAE